VTERAADTDEFYGLLAELEGRIGGRRSLASVDARLGCPVAGLYFFFEAGELRPSGESRVVRVGTHGLNRSSQSTLWRRLAQHRGRLGGRNPGGGNHRASVFRRHVGSALASRRGDEALLDSWLAKTPTMPALEPELEREVSRVIRAMPFLWLGVPTKTDASSDRGYLERNAIALLSTLRDGGEKASQTWLGRDAIAPKVRASSLWNVNHVDGPYDSAFLSLFRAYVRRH
jgi:hypothetical protein